MQKKKAKKTPPQRRQKRAPALDLSPAVAVRELSTVRDFIRYAVSRFSREELFFGHGTFNAFDEAVFLVLEGLRLPVEQLEPYYDATLLPAERKRIAGLVEQRIKTRKPTAYLVNKTYLKGYPFYVDERVIVPRSYIADLLFADVTGNEEGFSLIDDPEEITSVLDLCTGSGCLAIIASYLFPNAEVDAVDLSKDALDVARINVDNCIYKDRISLYQGDLFAPLKGKKYDFIITNPPYVDADDMQGMPPEYYHEPQMALAAGGDGLDIVHRILAEAPEHLNEGGKLICEIGYGREPLEDAYPDIDFIWLDTENSEAEVFWLDREQLVNR